MIFPTVKANIFPTTQPCSPPDTFGPSTVSASTRRLASPKFLGSLGSSKVQ